MDTVNLRDPNSLPCRVYVGHLNENITQELLDIKFSPYGKIAGFLRTGPGFAFVQYEQQSSALNAIQAENGSFLHGQKLLVKSAEMKSQKHKMPISEISDVYEDEPMNKKYFSNANEYYGNNSIMSQPSNDSDINHCEIIVVAKHLTGYAEFVESQLKILGIRVDLLFPNDQVPINKVLGNIQSRGCLYAILVLPVNVEQNSLTLTILYGDAAEHRNMPTDDAIRFIYKDFVNKTKKIVTNIYQHPDTIQTMLRTLTDNRSLTVLQYDHLIKHLSQRRELQRKAEIGEDVEFESTPEVTYLHPIPTPTTKASTQDELHKKVLAALNKKQFVQKFATTILPKAEPAIIPPKAQPMSEEERKNLKTRLLQSAGIRNALLKLKSDKKT